MKQIIISLFILLLCGCSNDNEARLESNYYIKYKAKAIKYKVVSKVQVTTETGKQYLTPKTQIWEQTFGPVSKGFEAKIMVYDQMEYIEIYCSRGEEPFALKASTSSGLNLNYTIDY